MELRSWIVAETESAFPELREQVGDCERKLTLKAATACVCCMNQFGPLHRRGKYIGKKGAMSTKWLDVRRKGTIEEGVLKANASTIQQSIRKLRKFFADLNFHDINKTLRENPSVVRTLDYGTCIGGTAMLMYACPECKDTRIRARDWLNGIKAKKENGGGTTELIHWEWFCALCKKKFITKEGWK